METALMTRLKSRREVTSLANDVFGIGRATLYKYIHSYENGYENKLPLCIRSYFHAIVNPKLSELYLEELESELIELRSIVYNLNECEITLYHRYRLTPVFLDNNNKPCYLPSSWKKLPPSKEYNLDDLDN